MNVFRDSKSPRGDARMRDYFIRLILKHTPRLMSYTINSYDTGTQSPDITLYSPGIGKDRKLIGTTMELSGSLSLSSGSGFNLYTFSGPYTIYDITDDDSIVVDLGFNNVLAGTNGLPITPITAQILSNERLVLHDILTTYRYSTN
jgi:hypothetical protein